MEYIKDVEDRTTEELRFRLNVVNGWIKELRTNTDDPLKPKALKRALAQRRALKKVINERTGEGPRPETNPLVVHAKTAIVGAKGQQL